MSNNPDKINIIQYVDKAEERFSQIAPAHMKFDAEKGFAIQLMENNPWLKTVATNNPASLLQAVTNVAAIGLSLNPAEKQAYLITRNVKVGDRYQQRVFLEPSYMGLCKLATDSGSIDWVQARAVYKEDTFVDNGPGEKPTHTYEAFAKPEDRGEFVGVFCMAKTATGDYLTTIMPAEKVYSIRDRSEAYKAFKEKKKGNGGPWVTDFIEMAKKSCVREGFKMWPRTDKNRMAAAVDLSNSNEGFEPIITTPDVREFTVDQKEYFDQLITDNRGLAMCAFQASIDEPIFINLYHSFPKGQKGKYQKMVDGLISSGFSQMQDYLTIFSEALESGDDMAISQAIEELEKDELDFILSKAPMEIVSEVEKMRNL